MVYIGALCVLTAFLWVVNWRLKGSFVSPSSLLLGAYVLCSFAGLFVVASTDVAIGAAAIAYYAVALGGLLFPIVRFDDSHPISIERRDTAVEIGVSYSLAALGVFSALYYTPGLLKVMQGNLADNRAFLAAQAGESSGFAGRVALNAAYLYPVMALLGFYWIATRRRIKLGIALLTGSCSYVVYVLNYAGRDALPLWTAAATFSYLLCRRHLPKKHRRIAITALGVVVCSLSFIFLRTTLERGAEFKTQPLISLVEYAGQAPINFSEQFVAGHPLGHGQFNAGLLYRLGNLLGLTEYNVWFARDFNANVMASEGTSIFVFSGIIGSWFMDFGKSGTLLLVGCVALAMRLVLGCGGKQASLGTLLTFTTYAQVMFGGLFYFFYGTTVGNFALLLSFGIAVAVTVSRRYQKPVELDAGKRNQEPNQPQGAPQANPTTVAFEGATSGARRI